MFCPNCGLEENNTNQFCRTCGADLRSVRVALETPDTITASAVSARDEIGRAFAAKIRETRSAEELQEVVEDVLPEIEKFLESPHEKRLRRMRTGTIVSSAGIGVVLMFLLIASNGAQSLVMIGAGLVAFFIGLGIITNGLFFTVPKNFIEEKNPDSDKQRKLDANLNDSELPDFEQNFVSVTENTTRQLSDKQKIPRNRT